MDTFCGDLLLFVLKLCQHFLINKNINSDLLKSFLSIYVQYLYFSLSNQDESY